MLLFLKTIILVISLIFSYSIIKETILGIIVQKNEQELNFHLYMVIITCIFWGGFYLLIQL